MKLILIFLCLPCFIFADVKKDIEQRARECRIIYLHVAECDTDNYEYLNYLKGKEEGYRNSLLLIIEEENRIKSEMMLKGL